MASQDDLNAAVTEAVDGLVEFLRSSNVQEVAMEPINKLLEVRDLTPPQAVDAEEVLDRAEEIGHCMAYMQHDRLITLLTAGWDAVCNQKVRHIATTCARQRGIERARYCFATREGLLLSHDVRVEEFLNRAPSLSLPPSYKLRRWHTEKHACLRRTTRRKRRCELRPARPPSSSRQSPFRATPSPPLT